MRGTGWSWRSAVTNLSDSLSRSQCQTSPYLYLEYPFVAPAARMLGHWSNLLPESQDFRRPELLGAIIRGSTLFYFVPHPSLVSVRLLGTVRLQICASPVFFRLLVCSSEFVRPNSIREFRIPLMRVTPSTYARTSTRSWLSPTYWAY